MLGNDFRLMLQQVIDQGDIVDRRVKLPGHQRKLAQRVEKIVAAGTQDALEITVTQQGGTFILLHDKTLQHLHSPMVAGGHRSGESPGRRWRGDDGAVSSRSSGRSGTTCPSWRIPSAFCLPPCRQRGPGTGRTGGGCLRMPQPAVTAISLFENRLERDSNPRHTVYETVALPD